MTAGVQIGLVRLAGGGRLRAEAAVAALDLPMADVDRSVLIIRRVAFTEGDPRQARAALAELRGQARRPAVGSADPGAAAVIFADEAELLTCLCQDAAAGCLADRWYWRDLWPARSPGIRSAQAVTWTRMARWLPAALAALPVTEAVQAVGRLSPAEAAGVGDALLAEYSIRLPAVSPPLGSARDVRGTAGAARHRSTEYAPSAATDGLQAPAALWTSRGPRSFQAAHGIMPLPPAAAALSPAGRALLGLALNLGRAPEQCADPELGDAVWVWLNSPPPQSATDPAVRYRTRVPDAQRLEYVTGGHADHIAPTADRSVPQHPTMTQPVDVPAARYQSAAPGSPRHQSSDARPGRAARAVGRATVNEATQSQAVGPVPAQPAVRASPWPGDGAFSSSIASALYLVNVLCWLELPGAQTTGQASGWAVLDLLARHLLAGEVPGVVGDPLWTMLSALDGRPPGEPPAVPAGDLVLPAGWLRRWRPGPPAWHRSVTDGRLHLYDRDGGFLVADLPAGTDLDAGLFELDAEAPLAEEPAPAPLNEPPWLASIGGFAAWLLRSRGVTASTFRHPGLISLTRTHLDVLFGLEEIDIDARRSGLDRDPGWIPALARIVGFHFGADVQE